MRSCSDGRIAQPKSLVNKRKSKTQKSKPSFTLPSSAIPSFHQKDPNPTMTSAIHQQNAHEEINYDVEMITTQNDLTTALPSVTASAVTSRPGTADQAPSIPEKIQTLPPSKPQIPDQHTGWQPWSVVLGGLITMFLSFGFLNGFAAFQSYYVHVKLKGYSNSEVAWIGSMQTFCVFAANLLVGPIFDKHGPRPLIFAAGCCFVLGCMLCSVADKYYQIFLCHGVLIGSGLGMSFITPAACVMQWFHQRYRTAALGIAMSGSSIGGIIWPIATFHLLEKVGYGWCWRILGFLGLALFPIAILLVRMPPHVIEARKNLGTSKPELSLEAFKSFPYSIMTFLISLFILGLMPLLFYFPELAGHYGASTNMQFYSISILNAVSFFGRMGMPILSEWTGVYNTTIVCLSLTSVVAFACMGIDNNVGALVAAGFFGLTSGGALSLMISCVPLTIPDFSKIGAQMGQMFFVASSCGLLTGSIGGWILGTTPEGNWKTLEGYVGGLLATIVLGLILIRNHLQPDWKKIF